jgi:hypothetical protein
VSVEAHGVRLDKVEGEITTVRTEMAGLKVQMRGFGDVLNRIEQGVASQAQQFHDDKQASRINPVALATVLVSVISILVGGAWLISGSLARQDERSVYQQHIIERMEQRQWLMHKESQGGSPVEANQL